MSIYWTGVCSEAHTLNPHFIDEAIRHAQKWIHVVHHGTSEIVKPTVGETLLKPHSPQNQARVVVSTVPLQKCLSINPLPWRAASFGFQM